MARHTSKLRFLFAGFLTALLLTPSFAQQLATVISAAAVFPGQSWQLVSSPEAVGFDRMRLRDLGVYVKTLSTTGLVVIVGGRVLLQSGDVQRVGSVQSISKSILAMLYGNYVARGTIDLRRTLLDLGMDDVGGLLPIEKTATIRDLLTMRSGVYHEASEAGGDLHAGPPRGSQKPGTYFLYSNWNFDAAGAAFEKLTHKTVYDALDTDLARPIEMQDFSRTEQHSVSLGDPPYSRYPANYMRLSTRDMARIGYLMLRQGKWNGRQVISEDWVRKITSVVTPVSKLNSPDGRQGPVGYGYMWWVFDGPKAPGAYRGGYSAIGSRGQYLTVLPALDMVVAHSVFFFATPDREVTGHQYRGILDRLIAAKRP